MPGWGYLLIGFGSALLLVLGLWLLLRRTGGRGEVLDRVALLKSERERAEAEVRAERLAREKIERVAAELERELREIAARRKIALEMIDEKSREKFARLSDDSDALLGKLDEILGRADPDSAGPPKGGG